MTKSPGRAALARLPAAPSAAEAQSYPSKTVTMIVTAAAGGVTDVVARAIGQRLSEKWGQQVVIENRGGGGHILGAQAVAKAAPDGHTLMVAEAGTYVINPNVYPKEKLNYDLEKDLIQITGLVRIHHALVATPSLPAKSLAELIALAKAKPDTLTYGTAGLGSGPHLNMVRLENVTGAKFVTVHYRGATPALTDVIGGHTNMMMISVGSALGSLEAGKVNMLAIGSPKRLPSLPAIPTAEESVPGYTAGTWFGLSVTAGTPREIVMKINAEVRQDHCRARDPGAIRQEAIVRADDELAGGIRPVHQDRDRSAGARSSASRTCKSRTNRFGSDRGAGMMEWSAAVMAFACLGADAASAQAYPTKPITILVPAAPGGMSDSLARAIGQRLGETWGQQIIVENRGGANHQIGAASVAKAPPDGHMLMLGAETIFVINPTLYGSKLAYDPKGFAPITGLVRANQALLAHPSFAPNNVSELIALAKRGRARSATPPRASARHRTSTSRCWRAWRA